MPYKLSLKQLLTTSCRSFINSKDGSWLEAFISYNLANGDLEKAIGYYKSHLDKSSEIVINNKTLIITDGYDEVKHLDDDSFEYKIIQDAIVGYKTKHKLIMTSRPNAADKNFKSQFGTLIKNEGLDNDCISEYITKLFGKNIDITKIENLLDSHPHIKELCKIPVNLSMLCSIFEGRNQDEAVDSDVIINEVDDINNMGDLYQKIIATLGKRFFKKHRKYSQNNT